MATTDSERAWASGITLFAGIWLLLVGVFQFFQGLVALLDGDFYVVGAKYTFELNVTGWGWIHLILGVLLALVGLAVINGSRWARIVAIVLAGLSALANFLFLPYYPLWAVILIAINVVVIWALSAAPADLKRF